MATTYVFSIDGAVVMTDTKWIEETGAFEIPMNLDDEYKHLVITDSFSEREGMLFPYVSKDEVSWVVPICVRIGDEYINPLDIPSRITNKEK